MFGFGFINKTLVNNGLCRHKKQKLGVIMTPLDKVKPGSH